MGNAHPAFLFFACQGAFGFDFAFHRNVITDNRIWGAIMGIRKRMLPAGWYPGSASGCREEIEQFVAGAAPLPAGAQVLGGIVPHAGWYFSGKAAARVFDLSARASQPQVVVVFGGHLGGDSPPLLVSDEAWETPLGTIPLATEFYRPLRQRLTLAEEYPGTTPLRCSSPW